ncbi:MAG: threonine synthase [Microthrixaceae bacterium]|nr:threonine synthase [Microthrixaceae bacterium]
MRYVSTRGEAASLGFADVLLTGLAPDGGLFVPETWPELAPLDELRGLSYPELAVEVMWPFVEAPDVGSTGEPEITREDFSRMVHDSYTDFDSPAICPVRPLGDLWLLELFHGPTLAFKDVALQLVGRLFDHVLTARGSSVTILGATSGDTGSAAMDAFSGLSRAQCVILFPDGRTSDIQRRQMTTIAAPNCHAVAVDGTFDDCQDLVKAAFGDEEFRTEVGLSAVNSINWGRVMAQVVYYVSAHLEVSPEGTEVDFCVPTGNFGNVLAGWVAKRMGLPIRRLVVASNRNDILTRTINDGDMSTNEVVPTTSPSMDIQVSSNFERLLFEVLGRDGSAVSAMLGEFRGDGSVTVPSEILDRIRADFDAGRLSDDGAADVIERMHEDHGVLLDPHSAVGVGVAERILARTPDGATPMVCLATAHPAKFPDAVFAASGVRPTLPAKLGDLLELPEHFDHVPDDLDRVEELVRRVLAVRD